MHQAPPPTPPPAGEGSRSKRVANSAASPPRGTVWGRGWGGGWAGLSLLGRLSGLGLATALVTFVVDQGHKWWMLGPFDIAARQPVRVTPFLDLVLTWNTGISYGWLAQETDTGRWALIALSVLITGALWLWLAQARRPLVAVALGLVIGGALANAMDRIVHGAVADFFLFHGFGFSWYVFNIADVAIVAGIGLLLYDSFSDGRRE
jgi:signal peptidase II